MPRSVFYQYQQSGEYLVSENSRCTLGTFYLTKWQLLKWYVPLVYLVGWQIILHFSTFTAILKNVKLLVCFFHDRRVSLLKILSCTLSFVKYNKKCVTKKCLTAVKRRIQLVASQIRKIVYTKHSVCFSSSGANSLALPYVLQEKNKTEFFLNERLTFLHYLFIIHYDHLLINSLCGFTYAFSILYRE